MVFLRTGTIVLLGDLCHRETGGWKINSSAGIVSWQRLDCLAEFLTTVASSQYGSWREARTFKKMPIVISVIINKLFIIIIKVSESSITCVEDRI